MEKDDIKFSKNMTMSKLKSLIENSSKKERIANAIYNRLYERYLKVFDFDCTDFTNNYKNGFSIMANCCLLIETLSNFLKGTDETPRDKSENYFKYFFKISERYKVNLNIFANTDFYKGVRCGILHQGETYGGFRIQRTGDLYEESNKKINATKFHQQMVTFLREYKKDLIRQEWGSEIWDNCRRKIRFIISNSM